jgi:hypothetical protein
MSNEQYFGAKAAGFCLKSGVQQSILSENKWFSLGERIFA